MPSRSCDWRVCASTPADGCSARAPPYAANWLGFGAAAQARIFSCAFSRYSPRRNRVSARTDADAGRISLARASDARGNRCRDLLFILGASFTACHAKMWRGHPAAVIVPRGFSEITRHRHHRHGLSRRLPENRDARHSWKKGRGRGPRRSFRAGSGGRLRIGEFRPRRTGRQRDLAAARGDLPNIADKPLVKELTSNRPHISLSVAGGWTTASRFADENQDQWGYRQVSSRAGRRRGREIISKWTAAIGRLTMSEIAALRATMVRVWSVSAGP